ncbi:MAG: hypothetical protein GEU93_02155 [Propionibacteriales bacterium]|nr:hypothetical protein [Propionibacteriales bacterium]
MAYLDVPTRGVVPKGIVPYRPHRKTRKTVDRIIDLYRRMKAADALPLGPRTVGYRLKENYVGEYTKKDFPAVGNIVKRLEQAGEIEWEWVADGAAVTYEADGWSGPTEFLADVPSFYHRDRREGQQTVVEIYAEARETLSLIHRLGTERGVTVYSGGGSCGPNLARKVAVRAVRRAVERGQSTLILGICDFDQAGIRNVLRPHIEHVSAFLYGTADNKQVLAIEDDAGALTRMEDIAPTVSFRHLGLTPEMAIGLVETEQDRERIDGYIASGSDIWDRDLDLLEHMQKIETEALDPVVLRDLVVDAIEEIIDTEKLAAVVEEERQELAELNSCLGEISRGWRR